MRVTPKSPRYPIWTLLLPLLAVPARAQQPFTQTAPIYSVNAQYVQGVAPGFWPQAGGGLTLNLAAGTSFCNNASVLYGGGSITLAASSTNYVYIDPVACIPASNTTGYPPSAVPLATVLTGSSAITTISDTRTWFTATSSAGPMLNAASFSGGSVGAQIDSACAALGGKNGAVVIPAAVGLGQSLGGLSNGCAVLDLRGAGSSLTTQMAPNGFGDENGSEAKFLFRERLGSTQPGIPSNQSTVEVYQEASTGGTNVTGSKSNYFPFQSLLVRRTPGQGGSAGIGAACYSQGDCEPIQTGVYAFEDQNAGGDEGANVVRVWAIQGNNTTNTEFHASVTSVSGNVVNYNAASNEDTRGEKRLLINTNALKGDSTGTITGIAGTPPVVSGSGTKFSTNHGGAGTKTSLCFELTGSAGRYNGGANPIHDVYQVASVASDTSLTLSLFYEGANQPWFGDVTSGNYTLYPCSTVTLLGVSGSVTVSDGSQFAAGDTVLMPLGHTNLSDLFMTLNQQLPSPFPDSAATVQNMGNRPAAYGLSLQGNWGVAPLYVYPYGLSNFVAPSRAGIWFAAPSTAMALAPTILEYDDAGSNNLVTALAIGRNAMTSFAYFEYDKSADNWLFGYGGGAPAGINAVTGQAGFGVVPQAGWQAWFNVSGTASHGVQVSLPANGTGQGLSVNYGGVPALQITGNGSSGSTWRIANGANLLGYSDNQATQTWNVNSSTGNAAFNNLPPVYNAAGTAQTGSKLHIVEDQVTLAGGSATVTLTAPAAFSGASSYKCAASDQTGASAVKIAYSSGTQFTVTGTSADVVSYVCVGN